MSIPYDNLVKEVFSTDTNKSSAERNMLFSRNKNNMVNDIRQIIKDNDTSGVYSSRFAIANSIFEREQNKKNEVKVATSDYNFRTHKKILDDDGNEKIVPLTKEEKDEINLSTGGIDTKTMSDVLAEGTDIGRQIMDGLIEKGYSEDIAAAFSGNTRHESQGFTLDQESNPLVKGSKGGTGWGMWTGERRVEFEKFIEEKGYTKNSVEATVEFIDYELKNKDSNVLNIINNFKDNGMYTPRSSNKSIDISKVNDMISNAETMSEKLSILIAHEYFRPNTAVSYMKRSNYSLGEFNARETLMNNEFLQGGNN